MPTPPNDLTHECGLVKVKVLKDIQNCEKMCVVKGFISWIVDKVKVKFKQNSYIQKGKALALLGP